MTFSWDPGQSPGDTFVITDALEVVVEVAGGVSSITVDLPASKTGDGRHWFQIQAVDFFGFVSLRTSPLALPEASPT